LLAVILEVIDVLRPELIFSLLFFIFSEVEEGSGDAFLESSVVETLLEKCLTV